MLTKHVEHPEDTPLTRSFEVQMTTHYPMLLKDIGQKVRGTKNAPAFQANLGLLIDFTFA